METIKNPVSNFPVINVLAAVIVTGMLLYFNERLSQAYLPIPAFNKPEPVIVEYTKPEEPIETEVPEVFTQEPVAQIKRDPAKASVKPRQEITVPIPPGNFERINDAEFTKFKPGKYIHVPDVREYFTPDQVDKTPRILRPVSPIYPYQATIKGIEGRVVLRFIVDENGKVLNPEVVRAEPEGVFEKAAITAIVKYKFYPAEAGGEKVKCSVVLPVGFRLNQ